MTTEDKRDVEGTQDPPYTRHPKVSLLSLTHFPVETVYAIWEQSRTTDPVPHVLDIRMRTTKEPEFKKEVEERFKDIVAMRLPVLQHIGIVLLIEDIPVALREQLVRHKIGHRLSGRDFVDNIPELADSSFWSQTGRIQNMSSFADEGRYHTPETLVNPPWESEDQKLAQEAYHSFMKAAQKTYAFLLECGIPIQDAREVLPLAMTHRMTWGTNLSALIHLCSTRTCWLAQLGFWAPVLDQILVILREEIHPSLESIGYPPCMDHRGVFQRCAYGKDVQGRTGPKDPNPPCPLYLFQNGEWGSWMETAQRAYPEKVDRLNRMLDVQRRRWRREPITGRPLYQELLYDGDVVKVGYGMKDIRSGCGMDKTE